MSNSLVDSGFAQALIREHNASQTDYSTVFYFNLFVSLLIYGILYAAAPAISSFFGEPQLVSLVRVLSIGIVINAFAVIPKAMFALLLQVAIGILFYIVACRIANITELKSVYGLIRSILNKTK